jgi:hypothetical protein
VLYCDSDLIHALLFNTTYVILGTLSSITFFTFSFHIGVYAYLLDVYGRRMEGNNIIGRLGIGRDHTCTITIKEHSWVRRRIPWDVDDLFTFGLGNTIGQRLKRGIETI